MVLEIGVGTGRIAKEVLKASCQCLVGIDISPKTLERARLNLKEYSNIELIRSDIASFNRPNTFVLSVSNDDEWFECNDRKIKLYPLNIEEYVRLFQSIGFRIESIQETESKFVTIVTQTTHDSP